MQIAVAGSLASSMLLMWYIVLLAYRRAGTYCGQLLLKLIGSGHLITGARLSPTTEESHWSNCPINIPVLSKGAKNSFPPCIWED